MNVSVCVCLSVMAWHACQQTEKRSPLMALIIVFFEYFCHASMVEQSAKATQQILTSRTHTSSSQNATLCVSLLPPSR